MTDPELDSNAPAKQVQPRDPASAEHQLTSLASSYQPEQHRTYVDHLDRAVADSRNRNIAITGRYGTGKSSVLDGFESRHEGEVMRVSITTLGPNRDGEGLTNRIQKELVKQLVYRLDPGKLKTSRFARTDQITLPEARREALVAVGVVGIFLGLAGWLPDVAGLPEDLSWSWSSTGSLMLFAVSWLLFAGLAGAIATRLRMAIDSRIITSLSTAGASITLGKEDDTYFDAYLDELVTHFDRGLENYVVFEDLDRFDDPAIFDSLRELNTILNSSARRRDKCGDAPLRFIYAIKDSLFERILNPNGNADLTVRPTSADGGSENEGDKPRRPLAANHPTLVDGPDKRGNRTKFFDVVIPLVPFLSHRNARDVLDQELKKRNIPHGEISRAQLSLVARHAADMRLLLNILNEYTVFAQKLLWVKHPAPDLNGDRLFALVAYKNFNLADFEAIPVRGSALDALDQAHRNLIRHAVSSRQLERREIRSRVLTETGQSALAEDLGQRAILAAHAALAAQQSHNEVNGFLVDGQFFAPEQASTIGFWRAVAQTKELTVTPWSDAQQHAQRRGQGDRRFDANLLKALFPEALEEDVWTQAHDTASRRRLDKVGVELGLLPGAGYTDLLERPEFTDRSDKTFAEILEAHVASDLGRELVRQGYINRNFATYSAAFYGSFAGIDAETFYYRAVQPNEMLLDHRFDSNESLGNMLDQLASDEPDFFNSLSVLNTQIVSYLLRERPDRAKEVSRYLATHFDDNAREFLSTFLADEHAPHDALMAGLAAHPWRGLFDYLTSEEVLEDQKLGVVDTAVQHASGEPDYSFGEGALAFIAANYAQMEAFTARLNEDQARVVHDIAAACDIRVEDLGNVPQPLRRLLVASQRYEVTANNLRAALEVQRAVPLDAVGHDEVVYLYVTTKLTSYLEVVDNDPHTGYAVEQPDTLIKLLELCDGEEPRWTLEQLDSVLSRSSPDSTLADLADAPEATWSKLAHHRRFALTVANLDSYIDQHGVESALATHLTADGATISLPRVSRSAAGLDGDDATANADAAEDEPFSSQVRVALALLNAHQVLEATDRARLAAQLDVRSADLPLEKLEPSADAMLAEALDRDILEPSKETFLHFAAVGWEAVAEAVQRHPDLERHIQPGNVDEALLRGLLADDAPSATHQYLFDNFDEFLPTSPPASAALHQAAARRAVKDRQQLQVPQISRVADHTSDPDLVVPLLALHQGLDGGELVAVLVKLDAPYSQIEPGQQEFKVPNNDAAATVFRRLDYVGKGKLRKTKKGMFFAPA